MKSTMSSAPSADRRQFLMSAATLAGTATVSPFYFFHKSDYELPLGVITYSFRSMPGSAIDLLGYLTTLGLRHVELMGEPAEAYAGAPLIPWRRRDQPETDEQRTQREAASEELAKWRAAASMHQFEALHKKYEAEQIKIDIVKFNMGMMSDEEVRYCFRVAKALGAWAITLERHDEHVERLGPFADQHQIMIGYHNHAQVNFNSWDRAIEVAKYNGINFDVGHYVAGTNESPMPLIRKYPDRITNLHLKDRKKDNGANLPWGEGDTPLPEILLHMRDTKARYKATIELEYDIPEGSDAVKEVARCIEYCKAVLA